MTRPPSLTLGWISASIGAAALVALALLAPVIGGEVGALIHHSFSLVCHQIPERSPHLHGSPAALCHRCTGIAGGVALGLLAAPLVAGHVRWWIVQSAQGRWLLIAVIPTALDWLLGVAGVWTNTPISRMGTGALFGAVAGVILACNLLASQRAPQSLSPTLTPDA